MTRFLRQARTRGPKIAAATIAATAGIVAAALVGVAIAKTFTLQVAKNGQVTNQSGATNSENFAVNSRGLAVYTLGGDSKAHSECTKGNGCFRFWPPLTVSSPKKLSKAAGINGKLSAWHRNGFWQVTLAGHPLYRYAADTQRHSATGEGVRSFGGTWHVVKAGGSGSGSGTAPMPVTTPTMTTTTTTTTAPCLYPPCY
jgi:predicted lipoprotein with Yx(FWY)xxD motif